jgi:Ser/Thr protein kinase RdoA (MazF antagonist)
MTTDQFTHVAGAGLGNAFFDSSTKAAPAPSWLRSGIVEAWRLDPVSTTVTLITVSENATYVVSCGGTPVAVTRVARPGYMTDAAEFESEVAWVGALAAAGVVRAPQGMATADGPYVAVIPDDEGARWSCVSYSYVTGSILEDITDPVPFYRQIGNTTARLHDHSGAWTPPKGFRRHSWELADMVGPTCRWGMWQDVSFTRAERGLLESAQMAAVATVGRVPRTPDNWGLIHADLRPSNIMIDGGELTVIDFDDCGYSWYLYDFAAALSFMEHVDDAPTMAKEWVEGYSQVRPLTHDDGQVACALSMIRRLQMLGWTTTHREDALPPALWAAQMVGTLHVAERFLEAPTWLLD